MKPKLTTRAQIMAEYARIRAEVEQAQRDVAHWNALHPDEEPLAFDANFGPDIQRWIDAGMPDEGPAELP